MQEKQAVARNHMPGSKQLKRAPQKPPGPDELAARLQEAEDTLDAIRTGQVDAIVVYGRDGEKVFTLQGAEYPYRVFVEAMSEGAATISSDFTILYCNRRFAEMIDYPQEEVVGTPLAKLVSEDDRSTLDALLQSAGLDSTRAEVSLRRKDGALLRVNFSLNPIRVEDSKLICLLATDLTGAEWSHELIASERLARAILNQAADAIVVTDRDGQVMRASDYAETLCGCNPMMQSFERVFQLELDDDALMTSGRKGNGLQLVNAVLNGASFRGVGGRLTRANGETCDVLLGARPLIVNGPIQGAVIVLSNVSALKRSERRLAVMYAVTNTLAGARSFEEAGAGVVEAVCLNLNAERAEIWRIDPNAGRFHCIYDWQAPSLPSPAEDLRRTHSIAPGEGLVGRILDEGQALFVSGAGAEPGLRGMAEKGVGTSAFGFPVRSRDGIDAVMLFFRRGHGHVDPELLDMLTALGQQIGQFMDRKLAEERSLHQQEAIRALSTPVLRVRDRVLALPLIGVIDPPRARQLTGQLLDAIRATRAKVVVMDVTGVAGMDVAVANHLVHTVKAARLLGAGTILCGVSRSIAGTLSSLDVDLSIIQTVADLQSGLEEAERILGYELVLPSRKVLKKSPAALAEREKAAEDGDAGSEALEEDDSETGNE